MKEDKKFLLHLIVSKIKEGKNPAKISKELKISKQNLQYYLRQLKEKRVIEKVGYGVWKVLKELKITTKATSTKQIRGHAFNWRIKFDKNIKWKKKLKENNIEYKLIGINNSTPRIIFNNKKIWLTKTGLVIYEPQSFFSQSSFTSKGMAIWELDKTIKALGRHLKIDLGRYLYTTSREHYAMIKNELAKQYDDKGERLTVKNKDGSTWLWTDFSHADNELETNEPMNSRGVQNWFNDHKKHNFEVTPTFVLEGLNKIKENFELMQEEINRLKSNESMYNLNKNIKDVQPPSYIM